MNTILEVNDLGKSYRHYKGEWRRVLSWFGCAFTPMRETWTLRHITFSLKAGEAVGIIGQNGAGKSTLLKLIANTLRPTQGTIKTQGKIAAILELGMGFHADLSGRANAYHAAGLMGYSQDQINHIIHEIESFAEIGDYFDKPVRLYSSGMQMRVAFAVATAFRPDILIIDEALSVGDDYFQHKSFDRIRQFRQEGGTLLFVSHDKSSILSLCDRALLLDEGKLLKDGDPESVMDYYNALIAEKENTLIRQEMTREGRIQTISGTGEAGFEAIELQDSQGKPIQIASVGEEVALHLAVKIHQDIPSLVLGYALKDRRGQTLFGTNTWHTKQTIISPKAGETYHFTIAFPINLGAGAYSITLALTDADTHLSRNYEWRDLAITFSVANLSQNYFIGTLWNPPLITWEKQNG